MAARPSAGGERKLTKFAHMRGNSCRCNDDEIEPPAGPFAAFDGNDRSGDVDSRPVDVAVRRCAGGASAGTGIEPRPESPLAILAFQSTWVRSVPSGRPEAPSLSQVEGDSMLPNGADGDNLLVDARDRERLRDGIQVLRTDDALLVKLLSVDPATKRLPIRSDNEAYPSRDDCDPSTVPAIGRVVWVGGRLA